MTKQWQELKETIIEMRDNGGTGTQQEVCKFLANLMDALEKQTSSPENPNRWIPVTERLPEVRQWVLCQCRAGIMDVLRLTADGSLEETYPHIEYMSGFVVAWMPLPEPYQEEES